MGVPDWLLNPGDRGVELQARLVTSLAIILLVWLTQRLILRLVFRRVRGVRVQYHWRKATTYACFGLGAFLVGCVWFEGIKSMSTFLGLLSAGIAIALREPLVNLAGWAFILWRRPLEVGDRIQIGMHRGDVIDQRIFMFTLMEIGNWVDADQSTGRVIHIPNGRVFQDALANYSKGFEYIWNELPVLVTFESDWRAAKQILLGIAARQAEHLSFEAAEKVRRAAEKYMIFFTHMTPTVYTRVRDSGVELTIRYLCAPRSRRGTEQAIWEEVLERFSERQDIEFAYPTQRFYSRQAERAAGNPTTSPDGKPTTADG